MGVKKLDNFGYKSFKNNGVLNKVVAGLSMKITIGMSLPSINLVG